MKTIYALITSLLLTASTVAFSAPVSESEGPRRGIKQMQVREQFGEPIAVKGPIGEPPITRWDYQGFSVYFEYETVLHTVHTASR